MDEVKQIKWDQQLYNPFRYGLMPELLHSNECTRTYYGKCQGMSVKTDADILLEVTFDKEYFEQYLIKKLLSPLQVGGHKDDFNTLMQILGKAYKTHKNNETLK